MSIPNPNQGENDATGEITVKQQTSERQQCMYYVVRQLEGDRIRKKRALSNPVLPLHRSARLDRQRSAWCSKRCLVHRDGCMLRLKIIDPNRRNPSDDHFHLCARHPQAITKRGDAQREKPIVPNDRRLAASWPPHAPLMSTSRDGRE